MKDSVLGLKEHSFKVESIFGYLTHQISFECNV